MGYQVVTEPTESTEYGSYAADYWVTTIPPGVYPVFAKEYSLHEGKNMYMNHLKDFNGISIWREGEYTGGNFFKANEDKGERRVVWSNPYAHALAGGILKNENRHTHLLKPFEAQKIDFMYDGKLCSTHHIVDRSLPEYAKENPMKIKAKSSSIDKLIKNAESRKSVQNEKSPSFSEREL